MSRKREHTESPESDSTSETETHAPKKPALAMPVFEIRDLIEELEKVCFDELEKLNGAASIVKLVEKYSELNPFLELVSSADFEKNWKQLSNISLRPKNMTLGSATRLVKLYLNQGDTVVNFDGYPANPRRAIDYYVAAKRKPHMTVVDSGRIRKAFTSDPEAEQFKKTAEEDRVRFLNELKAFYKTNESRLTESQKKYINNRLRTVKNIGASRRSNKKTAVQWYVQLNANLFEGLTGEKREKRIAKRFGKLTPQELDIYEKLANK